MIFTRHFSMISQYTFMNFYSSKTHECAIHSKKIKIPSVNTMKRTSVIYN